jgi:hypothetical protein
MPTKQTALPKTYRAEDNRIMVETQKGVAVSLGTALQLGLISREQHAAILDRHHGGQQGPAS